MNFLTGIKRYSFVSMVISVLASGLCGRALWCDEILRINGQHYTIGQLFAFKHLHDFCTQTPTGYLFMRPFQLAFGYEEGGFWVSAIAAAVITASTLYVLGKVCGGKPKWYVSLIIATNPLLCYYGSELAFYEMWAAAFAVSFALYVGRANRVWLAIAGSLFVTFHFAGMFIWLVFAGLLVLADYKKLGLRQASLTALSVGVPMGVNLPMYLGAEGKAIHLGSQIADFSKLEILPIGLWRYVSSMFPSFTGASFLGVAVFAVGFLLMLCKKECRDKAIIAIGSILAICVYLSYSALHGYLPNVTRYWIYALMPTLFVVGFCLQSLSGKTLRVTCVIAALMLAGNAFADLSLVLADGRLAPYKKFAKLLSDHGFRENVVYPNHYEVRFLGRYYALPNGDRPVIPAYWEQGEPARLAGLKKIYAKVPRSPVVCSSKADLELACRAGWRMEDAYIAKKSPLLKFNLWARLYPEPLNGRFDESALILPR